jgi:formylglycine-generating enzyme required for sulfatase activity
VRPDLAANLELTDREYLSACRNAEAMAKGRKRRVQAFIYVLLVGMIAGLFAWINQAYIKEQWSWFTTIRPYMVTQVRPHVLSVEAERALRPLQSFRECAQDCPEMVVVPAGAFMMGSPATERGRYGNEGPQHRVTIAKPFAVSKFDVTFADWEACVSVGGCPKVSDLSFGRNNKPLINVTWTDGQKYVAWLAKMTGRPYRLLTEAEWEYAARAGTGTAYYWGEEIGKGNANCGGCGSRWDKSEPSWVGSFPTNAFGLHDMAGNVWQWVQDCYHDDYDGAPTDGSVWAGGDCSRRIVRGGSWLIGPELLRSAFRVGMGFDDHNTDLGFRVARSLGP